MSEIVRIPFHGDDLLAVDHDGKPHVILKPAFESLGLAARKQIEKIQRQPWAGTSVTVVPTAGGPQRMVTADVRTFLMALATIPASRVAEHVRAKLVAYQSEVADVIEAYWTRGQVINPRVVIDGDFFQPHTLTYDEVAALIRQRYGLAFTVNELTRLLRTAGVLKQNGSPRKEYQHWFWFTGAAWNVHPHTVAQVAGRLVDTARELQDWRFLQARLELDGVGRNMPEMPRHIRKVS